MYSQKAPTRRTQKMMKVFLSYSFSFDRRLKPETGRLVKVVAKVNLPVIVWFENKTKQKQNSIPHTHTHTHKKKPDEKIRERRGREVPCLIFNFLRTSWVSGSILARCHSLFSDLVEKPELPFGSSGKDAIARFVFFCFVFVVCFFCFCFFPRVRWTDCICWWPWVILRQRDIQLTRTSITTMYFKLRWRIVVFFVSFVTLLFVYIQYQAFKTVCKLFDCFVLYHQVSLLPARSHICQKYVVVFWFIKIVIFPRVFLSIFIQATNKE